MFMLIRKVWWTNKYHCSKNKCSLSISIVPSWIKKKIVPSQMEYISYRKDQCPIKRINTFSFLYLLKNRPHLLLSQKIESVIILSHKNSAYFSIKHSLIKTISLKNQVIYPLSVRQKIQFYHVYTKSNHFKID